MWRVARFNLLIVISAVFAAAVFSAFPQTAMAEKLITVSANTSSVEADKTIDVPIYIDTDGDRVNAIGFNVDFSTETLEGLPPNRAGSVFNMWVTETSTRIDGGITGQQGFTGSGLVTTLRFKGRQEGTTTISLRNIRVLFAGATVNGFSTNEISISVYGQGEVPPEEPVVPIPGNTQKITLYPPTLSQVIAPNDTTPVSQSDITLDTSSSFGSKAQVSGNKGSNPEEPLKQAEVIEAVASVKGIFGKNSIIWTSILPTAILLAIVIVLGVRLYLNEKRRHAALERIMDKQLGALAALENKIEIIDQKGPEGKAEYLKELDMVKAEISAQTMDNKTKTSSPQAS